MKFNALITQDNELKISCTGKSQTQKDWGAFKDFFRSTLREYPQHKQVLISFEQMSIDPSVLGLLLKFINKDGYEIHFLLLHYSCFRMLEDLYLLEKFNVKYQKVQQ